MLESANSSNRIISELIHVLQVRMSNGVNCIFSEEDTSVVPLSKLTHEGIHEYLCTVAVFGIAVFPSLFHDSGIRNVGAGIPEFKKKRPLQESEKFDTTRYVL